MISYAQNLEDVLLWRALKTLAHGFYVDVGANDPVLDSVTKWFYDQGWSGINIEPSDYWVKRLRAQRHRDLNIQVAIGDRTGQQIFYEIPESGLSTLDAKIAAQHQSASNKRFVEHEIQVKTLTQVLDEFLPEEVQDIHFLKIDVEGLESAVLAGLDLQRFRPWIVVIEATLPQSQKRTDNLWQALLVAQGYQSVFFDGLNSYYVANEHCHLGALLACPANVFDDYVSSKVVALEQALAECRVWGERLDTRVNVLANELARQELSVKQWQSLHGALDKGLGRILIYGARTELIQFRQWSGRQLQLLSEQGLRTRGSKFLRKLWRHALGRLMSPAAEDLGVEATITQPANTPQIPLELGCTMSPRVFPLSPMPPLSTESFLPPGLDASNVVFRIFGHLSGHYSLALVNRSIAVALESLCPGQVIFSPRHGEGLDTLTEIPDSQMSTLAKQVARWEAGCEQDGSIVVSIAHHYPLIDDPEPADLRLVMFFWEESQVPEETVQHLNKAFDGVLVASRFVQSALRNSGCFLPIFVIPLGVDHLSGLSRVGSSRPTEGHPFTFLHVSSCFPRKGIDVLLQAYFEGFSSDDDVVLRIKTFQNCHNEVRRYIEELRAINDNPPRVEIDESSMSLSEMRTLYEEADVVVLPTRGEGFNLPAAEALFLGRPLLVTGYGAHNDFSCLPHADLIPFKFEYSGSHVRTDDSCWVTPDKNGLIGLMRSIRADAERGGGRSNKKTRRAQQYVQSVYQWGNTARVIASLVKSWSTRSSAPNRPRLALLSSWACRCGVAEYAQHLIAALVDEFEVDVYCDDRTPAAQVGVNVAWSISSSGSVLSWLQNQDFTDYEFLVVEHQPALFELSADICTALAGLSERGVQVILELHATKPLRQYLASNPKAVSGLSRLARVVVHTVAGMNELLEVGLAQNVMLLPHGVPDRSLGQLNRAPRIDQMPCAQTLTLGTFGFAFPHKGVDQIIKALPELGRRLKREVRLLALTSCLDDRCVDTVRLWQALAENLGVASRIEWITSYQEESRCLALLGGCDLLLYPYHETGDSASGAVTVGLASGCPVIVSNASIFDEWSDCTVRMPSNSAQDIEEIVYRLVNTPEHVRKISDRQSDWLARRSWSRVSERFQNLLKGLLEDKALKLVKISQEKPLRQLLVDVSTIYCCEERTGVQRVVRSILNELDIAPPVGFVVRPVYSKDGSSFCYTGRLTPANTDIQAWEGKEIDYAAGDVFLGLDLTAHLFPAIEPLLEKMQSTGVVFNYILHDILPITHPEWFPPGMSDQFRQWLTGLSRVADRIVTVSNHSGNELRSWLALNHPEAPVFVDSFRLGCDFEMAASSYGLPAGIEAMRCQWALSPTLLAVGTVEVRKGYDQIIDAMSILWERDVSLNLIIIGKPGWFAEQIIERLLSHEQLSKQLFWLREASDECLRLCYETANGLVAASYEEGFGLPLIEAEHFELPVCARDIPVFREVLADEAFYFSGGGTELAESIQLLLSEKWPDDHQVSKKRTRSMTWAESTNLLLSRIGLVNT